MKRFSGRPKPLSSSRTEYGTDPGKAMEHLRHFMISTTGSVLRAWIEFFDRDMDHRISKAEFSRGMRELGYKGDVFNLFSVLDDDDSNELTLDEVDVKQASIWRNFRVFVSCFKSEEELFLRCGDAADAEKGGKKRDIKDQLSREDFCIGLRKCGWTWSVADLNWVFDALHDQIEGVLRVEQFRWMGVELARKRKKQEAKARSRKWQALRHKQASPQMKHRYFAAFKGFLRKRYGTLIRAWRQALSQTDSMVLSKLHFLKAAARLGFAKESKELWKALDKDDSGSASIDELDPRSAELLAFFKDWVGQTFGSVREAFKAIDSDSTRFVTSAEFAAALQKRNFQRPCQQLFSHIDKDGDGKIVLDDILFLEHWNPLPFLLVAPNFKAKNEIRRLILVRTGQYMKAWRRLLDKDATNRCNWYEFKETCQVLGYHGDVAGAWRAFDEDLSGYISLKEIDEASAMILSNFRKWAIVEFGSLRSLFAVFDDDCSGSLSWQEFRYACNVYGYDGSIRSLFNALDVDQTGSLTLKEVVFLEDWDDDEDDKLRQAHEGSKSHAATPQATSGTTSQWHATDRPARRLAVVRRKRDLELRAFAAIPRLHLCRLGNGEFSWSFVQESKSAREPLLHTRQRASVRSRFRSGAEEISEDFAETTSNEFSNWSWEPLSLLQQVGLPDEGERSLKLSVPKGTTAWPFRPLKPTLDELFSPRRAQVPKVPFEKRAAYSHYL